MPSMKITGFAVALCLAFGVVALVRPGHAQPTNLATYEPDKMKEFKSPNRRS